MNAGSFTLFVPGCAGGVLLATRSSRRLSAAAAGRPAAACAGGAECAGSACRISAAPSRSVPIARRIRSISASQPLSAPPPIVLPPRLIFPVPTTIRPRSQSWARLWTGNSMAETYAVCRWQTHAYLPAPARSRSRAGRLRLEDAARHCAGAMLMGTTSARWRTSDSRGRPLNLDAGAHHIELRASRAMKR